MEIRRRYSVLARSTPSCLYINDDTKFDKTNSSQHRYDYDQNVLVTIGWETVAWANNCLDIKKMQRPLRFVDRGGWSSSPYQDLPFPIDYGL